jgi:DNA-binding transcriptional LysR family regulator
MKGHALRSGRPSAGAARRRGGKHHPRRGAVRHGAGVGQRANIDLDLEERPSSETVRAVAGGLADIGIVADAVDAAAELEAFPFAEDRLVVVTPRRHALGKRRQIAFHEALQHDFVGLAAGSALQDHLNDHAVRVGHRMKLRVRLPGFDAICRVVESGIGVAVVSKSAALRCRKTMTIKVIPLTDPWALRHLRICVRDLASLPAHAQSLVEYLRARRATPKSA